MQDITPCSCSCARSFFNWSAAQHCVLGPTPPAPVHLQWEHDGCHGWARCQDVAVAQRLPQLRVPVGVRVGAHSVTVVERVCARRAQQHSLAQQPSQPARSLARSLARPTTLASRAQQHTTTHLLKGPRLAPSQLAATMMGCTGRWGWWGPAAAGDGSSDGAATCSCRLLLSRLMLAHTGG